MLRDYWSCRPQRFSLHAVSAIIIIIISRGTWKQPGGLQSDCSACGCRGVCCTGAGGPLQADWKIIQAPGARAVTDSWLLISPLTQWQWWTDWAAGGGWSRGVCLLWKKTTLYSTTSQQNSFAVDSVHVWVYATDQDLQFMFWPQGSVKELCWEDKQ